MRNPFRINCTWLAVSRAPQHQPHCIRRPGGRPRLAFEFLHVAGGRWPLSAYGEVRVLLCPMNSAPQRWPHSVSAWARSGSRQNASASGLPCCAAIGEVRAQLAPGKLSAATPTAFHPRLLGEMRPHPAPGEIGAAVSRAPLRQPYSIRGPVGGPRLTFKVPRRRSTSEPAGSFAHIVKCARILRPVNWAPQPQPHFIRGPGGRPRLTFEFLLRRYTCSEAAGRFGHGVKGARVLRPVS